MKDPYPVALASSINEKTAVNGAIAGGMESDGKGKWRVSTNGGANPVWSGNAKEVFYRTPLDDLFVCPVAPMKSEIEVGTPQRLFHAASPGIGIAFDVSSDGKRLLVNHSEEEVQAPLQLLTNWPAELKR